jgi:hypothetical protein
MKNREAGYHSMARAWGWRAFGAARLGELEMALGGAGAAQGSGRLPRRQLRSRVREELDRGRETGGEGG